MDRDGLVGGRRQFLAWSGAAAAASTAGCLASVRDRLGGADGTERDVIRLDTLEVGGSPGGTVPLRAADRLSLVDFFATWCGPCRPQMGTLGRLRQAFDEDALHMTSVTTESDEAAVRQFWREYDGRWPVALNPESTAVREYSVKGIPTLVLVSPDRTVHWRHRGLAGYDNLSAEVESALE